MGAVTVGRMLVVLLMVAFCLGAVTEAAAVGWSRTWGVDTTFAAAAAADTIMFVPWSIEGRLVCNAWTVKVKAAVDSSTIRVDWFQLGGDTTGHTHFSLKANKQRRISGRIDSIKVYLPNPHQVIQFEIECGAGSDYPPDLGHDYLALLDSLGIVGWVDSVTILHEVEQVDSLGFASTLDSLGRWAYGDSLTALAWAWRVMLVDSLTRWAQGDSLVGIGNLANIGNLQSLDQADTLVGVGNVANMGNLQSLDHADSLTAAAWVWRLIQADTLIGVGNVLNLANLQSVDLIDLITAITRMDSLGKWTAGDSLGQWTFGDSLAGVGNVSNIGNLQSLDSIDSLTAIGTLWVIPDTVHVREVCVGCPVIHAWTVSTTQLDSLPGAAGTDHRPFIKVIIETDADVYYNWYCPNGDTSDVVGLLRANRSITLTPVSFYRLKFAAGAGNAEVQTILWPAEQDAARP